MDYQTQQAVRALLADLCGQRIVRAELADGGALGITTETGQLVVLATLQKVKHDTAPALSLAWEVFTTGAGP